MDHKGRDEPLITGFLYDTYLHFKHLYIFSVKMKTERKCDLKIIRKGFIKWIKVHIIVKDITLGNKSMRVRIADKIIIMTKKYELRNCKK